MQHFFGTGIFSDPSLLLSSCYLQNSNFFRVKLLPSSYLLRTDISLAATFLQKELVQNRDTHRRATFSKQIPLYSITFFRTATFTTKLILQKTYLLRTAIFLEKLHFGNSYFFRKAMLPNLLFSEEVLLRSCTSFPQLHYLQWTLSISTTLSLEYIPVSSRNLGPLEIYVVLKLFFSLYLEHSQSWISPYL